MSDYPGWPKTPRLDKQISVTEKIDGTNGLISIQPVPFGTGAQYPDGVSPDGRVYVIDFSSPLGSDGLPTVEFEIRAGSRNRWLTADADNFGFFAWVNANAVELSQLGDGRHYGEWFGKGIQRGYGLDERRFALFNVARWKDDKHGDWVTEGYPYESAAQVPDVPGLTTVPLLLTVPGAHLSVAVEVSLGALEATGSAAVRGFPRPEGVIVFHSASGTNFKAFTEWGGK